MTRLWSLVGAAMLAAATALPAQQATVDVTGEWEISSETPRGTMTRVATFAQDGETLTGTIETRGGTQAIEHGSVKGNAITFTVVFTRGERTFEVTYTGTVEGDSASGVMTLPMGDVPWTAKRKP